MKLPVCLNKMQCQHLGVVENMSTKQCLVIFLSLMGLVYLILQCLFLFSLLISFHFSEFELGFLVSWGAQCLMCFLQEINSLPPPPSNSECLTDEERRSQVGLVHYITGISAGYSGTKLLTSDIVLYVTPTNLEKLLCLWTPALLGASRQILQYESSLPLSLSAFTFSYSNSYFVFRCKNCSRWRRDFKGSKSVFFHWEQLNMRTFLLIYFPWQSL